MLENQLPRCIGKLHKPSPQVLCVVSAASESTMAIATCLDRIIQEGGLEPNKGLYKAIDGK